MGQAHPPLTRSEEVKLFAVVGVAMLGLAGLVLGILALAFGAI